MRKLLLLLALAFVLSGCEEDARKIPPRKDIPYTSAFEKLAQKYSIEKTTISHCYPSAVYYVIHDDPNYYIDPNKYKYYKETADKISFVGLEKSKLWYAQYDTLTKKPIVTIEDAVKFDSVFVYDYFEPYTGQIKGNVKIDSLQLCAEPLLYNDYTCLSTLLKKGKESYGCVYFSKNGAVTTKTVRKQNTTMQKWFDNTVFLNNNNYSYCYTFDGEFLYVSAKNVSGFLPVSRQEGISIPTKTDGMTIIKYNFKDATNVWNLSVLNSAIGIPTNAQMESCKVTNQTPTTVEYEVIYRLYEGTTVTKKIEVAISDGTYKVL